MLWISTIMHCLLHLSINIGCFILYYGSLVPIESNIILKPIISYFVNININTNMNITYSSIENNYIQDL